MARYRQQSHSFEAAVFQALGHSPAGYPGDTEPIKGGMETPGWSTVSGLGDIALGRDFSASYVPERRGIKVDPMIALRQE